MWHNIRQYMTRQLFPSNILLRAPSCRVNSGRASGILVSINQVTPDAWRVSAGTRHLSEDGAHLSPACAVRMCDTWRAPVDTCHASAADTCRTSPDAWRMTRVTRNLTPDTWHPHMSRDTPPDSIRFVSRSDEHACVHAHTYAGGVHIRTNTRYHVIITWF